MATTPYPTRWEADVILRDGAPAHVRPIRPQDADAVQAMHLKQSANSVYMRFFAPMPRISDRDLRRFTTVDHTDRVAFVILVGEEIIGIGRYDRINTDDAEVAFNISDQHQGRGLGSVLLEHLAAAARERGIHRFVAEVLPQNRRMVSVFKEAGYEVSHRFEDGVIEMEFPIDPTEASMAVMAAREHRAEANSLAGLLRARSLAVVGAGRGEDSLGALVVRNIVAAGYTGTVHVVHPELDEIEGIATVRSLTDIEGGVHLVLFAVPAQSVMDMLLECAAAKARGLVVYTSGFAETGEHGAELQRTLVRRARGLGMRVIGPSTLGIVNTAPMVRLNATPVASAPETGHLGLFSQSAALGVALLADVRRQRLAVSSFVNAGNRSDVSGNDLMQLWQEDEQTRVVALCLESVGNPRKFTRIARELAAKKPVVVVRAGDGRVPGQTVRTSTVPGEVWDAMLSQAGVIRAGSIREMFDVARLLLTMPVPDGPRVAVVTNSAALAAIVADAARGCGLDPAPSPVVVGQAVTADDLRDVVTSTAAGPGVDSVVVACVPRAGSTGEDLLDAVRGVDLHGRALVVCVVGLDPVPPDAPAYPTPQEAVRALALAVGYGRRLRQDVGAFVNPDDVDASRARGLVEENLPSDDDGGEPVRLPGSQVARLLECYGVRLVPSERAHDADEAVRIADRLGWPVALKYGSRRVRDRESESGYRLNLAGRTELRAAYADLAGAVPASDLEAGFWVQPMVRHAVAVDITTVEDALFGPVLSFGLHGSAVELLGDIAYRVPPLTGADISQLVRDVRASARLFGYRGSEPLATDALEDLIARVSRLADDLPQVARLELKPVMVTKDGVRPLGCRVWLARPEVRTDDRTRRVTLA